MSRPRSFIATFVTLLACLGAARAGEPVNTTPPQPVTNVGGPFLEFEFPGLLVGVAEYAEGPTGTTVFDFPGKVKAAVDVRGGSPVTVFTDSLRQGYDEAYVDAIVLTGGSAYGLASVAGVSEEIKSRSRDPGAWNKVAVVPGAVIFDLGDRRYDAVTPDVALGRAALRAAAPGRFPLGAHGAGRFAMQGSYFGAPQHSGQGGAAGRYGPTRIAVFTVVNALGSVVDRTGHLVRCGQPATDSCGTIAEMLAAKAAARLATIEKTGASTAHTTISIVVTNQKMSIAELQRLATQVHSSMARAIQPFSSIYDGDTLFAVTTSEIDNPSLSISDLGTLAGELAWDAVLASQPALAARPRPSGIAPPASDLAKYRGTYVFAQGIEATVASHDGRLVITAPDRASLYLPPGRETTLTPAIGGDFLLDTPRADVVRFTFDARGRVSGLIIEPGEWPVQATRRD